MKFLLILLLPSLAYGSAEIEDAKRSVLALIQPLMAGSSKKATKVAEKFRVDDCGKHKIDWMAVLFERKSATMEFKFKEGCDIQGKIQPKILHPFEANLDLRNIKSYDRVETINKVTADLQAKPVLNLEMREGLLTGKKTKVRFEADYKVRVSPAGKETISENLGGELRISEINGKKVNIKEKIFIK